MATTLRCEMEKLHMLRITTVVATLLMLLGVPVGVAAQTETVIYFHTDAVGSVRMTTDANGQVLQRYDYTPFGEPWPAQPTPEIRRFGGQELDAETQLNYFGARLYLPQTGRFTRADDPGYAKPFDPQSMNMYSYTRNNPLRWIDPTGHEIECPEVVFPPEIPRCSDEIKVVPEPLRPLVPWWWLQARPNYPGAGASETSDPGTKPKSVLGEIADTLMAPFEPGPPACLGIVAGAVWDELNPVAPGAGEAAGVIVGSWYSYAKYNEALEYALTKPSRRFGTPFLLSPNKSSVYRGLMKQSGRGGLVGLLISANVGLARGLAEEWQSAQNGTCR